MATYNISSTTGSVGDTITLSVSNTTGGGTCIWVIDLNDNDYEFSINGLRDKGKLFDISSTPSSSSVTLTEDDARIHTLTPITFTVPNNQYLSAIEYNTSISTLMTRSLPFVTIGETFEVDFNRNIYGQLKYLINRWTNPKDKLERSTNDNVQVIDTLTDDARCKNSWTYWGQYQGLSDLTNSSFSLSAQGEGGVKYTNNDPNEEDVTLKITLTNGDGGALIGYDDGNDIMLIMVENEEMTYNLEYQDSIKIQYNDTSTIQFVYSVQGVTDVQINSIANIIYPVGSIYMSVNSTSPQVLFGGRWTQLKDRFLLGSGDTYTNASTGGASTVALTKAQMPRHNHTQAQHRHKQANKYSDGTGSAGAYMYTSNRTAVDHYTDYQTPVINHTGGTETTNADANGSPHENMPPYLAVYMWKRIA